MGRDVGNGRARITGVATALPPYAADQEQARRFFLRHYEKRLRRRSLALLRQVLGHAGVHRRHFALERPERLVDEDPDARIDRYTRWAVTLSKEAAQATLADAGVSPEAVRGLVVNTCTGYLCPGLTSYLVEELGLAREVRAFDLVGSGCGGALPALEVGRGQLAASGGPALLVSVEICSATFQMGDDPGLLVSNALFGDGAAAALVWDRPEGLAVVDSLSRHHPEERDAIRYVHRGGNLHNQLSPHLPAIVEELVDETVRALLHRNGLTVGEVDRWAFHGGGSKILDGLREQLGLTEADLASSRAVMERYGNVSSATVWFALKELLERGVSPGERVVMVSFGAGLSAHACLLEA